ncbi:uncharacterized protein MONBRDRAFT_30644 [Monosiga brevicollis MX1]|uniref:Sulfotransferase domain-containing protein n=1 Tax=Monosiga brevicollis TaxID=81824 RepID=A9VEJ5_MONBE|nr:uncharacterized protein MONBRDRAFT_30644 [Monosiga brevicollis MX1]EDQ84046.1 predicted protein [Monosiga brevicollis MX1]|eukprot:XP_001751141.1 hypothetical protein [Monosiga brevicollis MX1]
MDAARVARMHSLLPSVRLIASLRDPAARAYSHFQHNCREGDVLIGKPGTQHADRVIVYDERNPHTRPRVNAFLKAIGATREDFSKPTDSCTSKQFETVLLTRLDGTRGTRISHNESMAFAILERGFYAEQLDVITQYYPRDQIHLNLYEAMSKDMISHINDIQTWLGLPFFDYSPLTRINARGYVSLQAVKSKTDSKPYESLGDDVYQLLVEMYLPSVRDLARYIDKSLLRKHWHIN